MVLTHHLVCFNLLKVRQRNWKLATELGFNKFKILLGRNSFGPMSSSPVTGLGEPEYCDYQHEEHAERHRDVLERKLVQAHHTSLLQRRSTDTTGIRIKPFGHLLPLLNRQAIYQKFIMYQNGI